MSDDLYKILGVRRNASAATIKKAFRAKVKTAHPDQGGSREDFDRVHQAYSVLMDPDRREKYDATGKIETVAADNAVARIMQMVVWAFDCVLERVIEAGANIEAQNVIDLMRQALTQRAAQIGETRDGLQAQRVQLERASGRFRVRGRRPNRMRDIIAAKLAGIDDRMRRHDREEKDIAKALELLDPYSFDQETVAQFTYVNNCATNDSTSTASW